MGMGAMEVEEKDEEGARFQVSLRLPTEDYVVVPDVGGDETVAGLKARVREITGLDPDVYTLVYKDEGLGRWEGDLSTLRVDAYGVNLWDSAWVGEDATLEDLGIARLLRRFPALQCPQPAASSSILRVSLKADPPRAPGAAIKVASLWDKASFAQGKVRSADPARPPMAASDLVTRRRHAASTWKKAGGAARAAVRMAAMVASQAPKIARGGPVPDRSSFAQP